MKTIRIMAWNWLEPLHLEAIEDKETPGRYGLHLSEAQLIVDAWKNAPKEEGMTVREWSYSTHGDTFFVTALYDAGELNIDYWMPDGVWWTDQMPFDFEISEEGDIFVEAALNLYAIDISLAPMYRILEPARFKALHDRLVVLGQIDPEKDPDFWKNEAEDES